MKLLMRAGGIILALGLSACTVNKPERPDDPFMRQN